MRKSWLRRHRKLWVVSGVVAFALWLAWNGVVQIVWPVQAAWLSGFGFGALATMISAARQMPPGSIENWQDGAYGEESTAKQLASLPRDRWTVLHDLADGTYNIDHVVIGPPGVFCVNSKMSGYRLVDRDGVLRGVHRDDPNLSMSIEQHLRGAKREAARLSALVSNRTGRRVWVKPVVVWWGGVEVGGRTVDGVAVVAGEELAARIQSLPDQQVSDSAAIAEALRPGRHRDGFSIRSLMRAPLRPSRRRADGSARRGQPRGPSVVPGVFGPSTGVSRREPVGTS